MTFEQRLSREIGGILALVVLATGAGAGCSTEGKQATDLCQNPEKGYDTGTKLVHDQGYIMVGLGEECPSAKKAELSHVSCCPGMEQVKTCSFSHTDKNMVKHSDGYGPSFFQAEDGDTDAMDLCWYDAVFVATDSCCGRPLQGVQGPVVAAPGTRNGDWSGPAGHQVPVPPAIASQAAAYWLVCGGLEHASVASFARFTMELMALGAPPQLLVEAQQAALDEVRHAQRCYALAQHYLGRPIGPGPLDLGAANPPATGAADIAEALVREGCIGETLAAIEAATRLSRATEPSVRAALTEIVDDESKHAAFAWRALRWMLARDASGAVRSRVEEVLAEERQRWTTQRALPTQSSALARAHGLLTDSERDAALAHGFEAVVQDAWRTMQDELAA